MKVKIIHKKGPEFGWGWDENRDRKLRKAREKLKEQQQKEAIERIGGK